MEPILSIAVVLVICVILNIPFETVFLGAVFFAWAVFVIVNILLLYFFAGMIFSERRSAEFSKIDEAERWGMKTAYYIVEGTEYPCVFPAEGVMNSKLYRTGKKYHVMFNSRMKCVYDRFACTTCTLGLIFTTFITVAGVYLFVAGDVLSLFK